MKVHLDPSIDLLETILLFLLVFCYPLFMINTASTLAIAKPAYLHTLLGFVEPKPNATFCRNQQTGAVGGNGINPTSELIFLFLMLLGYMLQIVCKAFRSKRLKIEDVSANR